MDQFFQWDAEGTLGTTRRYSLSLRTSVQLPAQLDLAEDHLENGTLKQKGVVSVNVSPGPPPATWWA